jgi:hypothetical protein
MGAKEAWSCSVFSSALQSFTTPSLSNEQDGSTQGYYYSYAKHQTKRVGPDMAQPHLNLRVAPVALLPLPA